MTAVLNTEPQPKNPKSEKLAEEYLGLAKAKSRDVAKALRRVQGQIDINEIESDAALYLCKAIKKLEAKGEGGLVAGYFKRGLDRWAENYVITRARELTCERRGTSKKTLPTERLSPKFDRGVEEPSLMEQEEAYQKAYEDMLSRSTRLGKPQELQAVILRVVEDGWTKAQIIELVGTDRFYKVIQPALFQLAREGGVEVDSGE